MLESSQRIDHLAELARARLPGPSDPGPPGPLPPSISSVNILAQIYVLLLKTLIYSQPGAIARFLQKILISASLSIILGAIFWDVSNDTNLYLRDRIGLHYASLGVLCWPLNLIAISDVFRARPSVERDIKDGLYGRFVYIFVEVSCCYNKRGFTFLLIKKLERISLFQLLCAIPSWCVIFIIYLAPAFAMSGLHLAPDEDLTTLWNYLSHGLLYLMFQHLICVLFAHVCKWPGLAAVFSGIVIGEVTLAGGVSLHLGNFPWWYRQWSPLQWMLALLLPEVHGPCKAKQIQRQDIILKETCDSLDGAAALQEVGLDKVKTQSVLWLGISTAVMVILIVIGFLIFKYTTPKRPRSAPNKP